MDWIKKWSRRTSIPVAFIICALSCLLAANSLVKLTVWFAQKNMDEIEKEYVGIVPLDTVDVITGEFTGNLGMQLIDEGQAPAYVVGTDEGQAPAYVVKVDEGQAPVYLVKTDDGQLLWKSFSLPEKVKKQYDFYVSLDDIAAVLWYSVCLCLAALIFYLWKIKKPFRVLNQAVQKVSANDLDFCIEYEGQDEFGRLCHAFESMRQELEQNNKKMWNSVEERKRLNAAFAHDLRTPLTVMRGHTDMLLGTITEETDPSGEMASSVHAISNQITRLCAFADTMGSLQRLEDYEPCLKVIPSSVLIEMVSQTATALFPTGQVEIHAELKEQDFLLDKEALAQICENILSNAARYVKEVVTLSLEQEQEYLIITVEDDGTGFTKKDLANASLAYYRGEKTQSGTVSHFGLGLYISSILAEKLGGGLQLSNGASGGAKIQIKVRCI